MTGFGFPASNKAVALRLCLSSIFAIINMSMTIVKCCPWIEACCNLRLLYLKHPCNPSILKWWSKALWRQG